MTTNYTSRAQRLELCWIGKSEVLRIEPRVLLEDALHSIPSVDSGSSGTVIHGDNLLALKAIEQTHAGKVRCIYIDPPYNTGSAFAHYDDGIEHSLWLSLLQARLRILASLLTEDGSIWISIDDNECHYLKILCDEILGRCNFVTTIIWEKRTSRENRRAFSFNHDYVLVYARDKTKFESARNPIDLTAEVLARYKNPDNDPRGPWQSVSANAQAGHATASQFYTLTLPSGRLVDPPKGRCWLYTKEKMQAEVTAGNIWFGEHGDNAPRVKKFLRDSKDTGLTPETIWRASDVGTNDDAKKHLISLLPDASVFDNPKPEALLQRILHIATNPGDLVLDSFAGSGTTGAVAHKMGRRWIMVELGDHCDTHVVPRLRKVIDGQDPGGVTEATGWKGGGGFRYYRLAPTLLERDDLGQWVINPEYNKEMLAEAVCKHESFTYDPSPTVYWQHGHSTERSFIYVTTQTLSAERLDALSAEVGPDRKLLVVCLAYRGAADRWLNLTVRKLPNAILDRCEWGRDDYSLKISSLGDTPVTAEADEAAAPALAKKKPGRKPRVDAAQPDLFSSSKPASGEDP